MATEVAGVGVWEWRLETDEMIYSPQARAIWGFPADGPVTREMIVQAIHPDDRPKTFAQAARAYDPALRGTSSCEYRIIRPDGECRWVVATGEALFEPRADGRSVARRYIGTLIDITARKLADEAVRESEQQLRLALQSSRMAAWRISPEGTLEPNPALNAPRA